MDKFSKIFENNRQWIEEKLSLDPQYFDRLAAGQAPEFLYIGCSDSRATAEELMGMQPGDVFVHRNVANMVVPTDNSVNAVIQFAVEFLKVKHIIVCGHYGCGGVKAAMTPSDMGQLNNWLQMVRDVIRIHHDELDEIKDEEEKYKRLVELNVQEQCINVIKSPHVQRAWNERKLPTVHGWIFDLHTGKLIDLGIDMGEAFGQLKEIYELKT